MQKVLCIQTGGTIDKHYPTGKGVREFVIAEPAVGKILSRVGWRKDYDYNLITVAKKDSLDLTEEEIQSLIKCIEESKYEKILVTIGTDRMIEIAKRIKVELKTEGKTVVLTGAALPERCKETDADFNVGFALATLLNRNSGVFICMNGKVFVPEEVEKTEDGTFRKSKK